MRYALALLLLACGPAMAAPEIRFAELCAGAARIARVDASTVARSTAWRDRRRR